MLLSLYKTISRMSTPLLEAHLRKRVTRGKEDSARGHERRGRPARPRAAAPLVWCHAASVGESIALLATVRRLMTDFPGIEVMMTTGTVTSAKVMAERLPQGAFHQYLPVDHPAWVKSFLDHWRPDLVLWSESELWPNILMEIKARDIPAVLLNARMSEATFQRWKWAPAAIAGLLSAFRLCLAQNEAEAVRLSRLGGGNVETLPSLKYASPPLPHDAEKLEEMKRAVGIRPLVLWASTHAGEEEIAGRLHLALEKKYPGLLTIVVPRHPSRGGEVCETLAALGLRVSRRSEGALPAPGDGIYVADTLGETGLFYRLSRLAIVGGSFRDGIGGHNPIEPAQLGCVIFYGPYVDNCRIICEDFESRKASLRLRDEQDLHENVAAFLASPESFAPMADAAAGWAREKSHIVDDLMDRLAPYTAPFLARKAGGA